MAVSFILTLDTTVPVVTVTTGPDYSTISLISDINSCTFSWSANEAFIEYKVCVVPANTSPQDAGIEISTLNGSINMSATGDFMAGQVITSIIVSSDLEDTSPDDGAKIIKVFVKDTVGNWSA